MRKMQDWPPSRRTKKSSSARNGVTRCNPVASLLVLNEHIDQLLHALLHKHFIGERVAPGSLARPVERLGRLVLCPAQRFQIGCNLTHAGIASGIDARFDLGACVTHGIDIVEWSGCR